MTDSYQIISTNPRTRVAVVIGFATNEIQATAMAEALQAQMRRQGSHRIITVQQEPAAGTVRGE